MPSTECDEPVGAGGDPITQGEHGEEVRFYISTTTATCLIKQGGPPGIEVVVTGGPAVGKGAVKRGDWMTEIDLLVGGELLLKAKVQPIVGGLLPANLPAHPASLTSLNLTTHPVGTVIREAGSFSLQAKGSTVPVNIVVSQNPGRRIGIGYVETATIKVGDSFEMMLWTSKANKFASELDQIAHAHLDFKLLKYDPKTSTGPLPEMWGLQPMSDKTKAMLSPHAAA